MSVNIFVWAVALLCHAACHSFGALFAVRFILGVCEGAITPGFMIVRRPSHMSRCAANPSWDAQVTSMFYTREEQTRRVGYWCEWGGFESTRRGTYSHGQSS